MEFASKRNRKLLSNIQQVFSLLMNKAKLLVSCCTLCGNSCHQHQLLCRYCQADLPYFKESIISFDLLSWPALKQAIPKAAFDHLHSLAPYQWPFSTWLQQFKYQARTELAELLAYLLAQRWQQYLATTKNQINPEQIMVLSVPLHITKWQERGFNQAHLIAKNFAKQVNYRYQPELIIRNKITQSQVGKSGVERRKNLANAFTINSPIVQQLAEHIILIDDVVTTGTTANEICKLLKKKGAQKITLLSICLALPN